MTKEALLEVAFEKFAAKGYNTTLSEIAQGAGIKKQSIYNHFKNKDDLLYETIRIELLGFYSSKNEEFERFVQLPPAEALRAMFFSICEYYRDINKLKFWRWILLIESRELFIRCRETIRENERAVYGRVAELLKAIFGVADADESGYNAAVLSFVVMIQGVLDGMLLYHGVYDPQILAENAWSHYWKSVVCTTHSW